MVKRNVRSKRIRNWIDFNREVKKGMLPHAKKRGWKLGKNSHEPVFIKGKGRVHMHTDDALIFPTIAGEFEIPQGKRFAKHYPQNMYLFSGRYSKARVKKYIGQGKKSITQINQKLPRTKSIMKKIKAKKKSQVNYALVKGKKGIQSFKGDPRGSKRPKGIVVWTDNKQGIRSWVKQFGTKAQKKNILGKK